MSMTRDQFARMDRIASRCREASATARHLEAIRQAAVKTDLLTGDPLWDTFLTYLQELSDRYGARRDAARSVMVSDAVTGHKDLLRAKIDFARCDEAITAIGVIMRLPKDMKARGDKAKELIDGLDVEAAA